MEARSMRSRCWQGQAHSDSTLVFPSLWSHGCLPVCQTLSSSVPPLYMSVCQDLILSWLFLWRISKVAVFWGKGVGVVLFWFWSLTLVFGHAVHLSHHRAASSAPQDIFSEAVYPLHYHACISRVSLIVLRITSIHKWSFSSCPPSVLGCVC